MQLNLKQLLALAIFTGSTSCITIGKDELIKKIKAGKDSIEKSNDSDLRKKMIHVLGNPE